MRYVDMAHNEKCWNTHMDYVPYLRNTALDREYSKRAYNSYLKL